MKMTYDKPMRPGYYWYSKCFRKNAPFETAPYGIVYVGYSDEIVENDNVHELICMSPTYDILAPLSVLSGMFSDEPIPMPRED